MEDKNGMVETGKINKSAITSGTIVDQNGQKIPLINRAVTLSRITIQAVNRSQEITIINSEGESEREDQEEEDGQSSSASNIDGLADESLSMASSQEVP